MRLYLFALVAMLSACGGREAQEAQELVRHDMLDPSATQFRNMAVNNKGGCVTGEVNGKNRFGAYTGFRPFVVDIRSNKSAVMPDEPASNSGQAAEDYALQSARFGVMRMDCGVIAPSQ